MEGACPGGQTQQVPDHVAVVATRRPRQLPPHLHRAATAEVHNPTRREHQVRIAGYLHTLLHYGWPE